MGIIAAQKVILIQAKKFGTEKRVWETTAPEMSLDPSTL
jgi:hypothetical protein